MYLYETQKFGVERIAITRGIIFVNPKGTVVIPDTKHWLVRVHDVVAVPYNASGFVEPMINQEIAQFEDMSFTTMAAASMNPLDIKSVIKDNPLGNDMDGVHGGCFEQAT